MEARRNLGGMDLGPTELLIVLLVVLLLFGAKRLPEIARGSGRALRIFKEEIRASEDPSPESSPEGRSTPPA